MIVVNAFI